MKLFSWLQDLKGENQSAEFEEAASPALQARLNELEKMSVREVMTPRAVIMALDVDVQLRRARRVKTAKVGFFPVYQGDLDHILGWISKHKVLELLSEPVEDIQLAHYLRPVGEIDENASVADLADAFLKSASPFMVVKNSHGSTVGIVPLHEFVELVFGFDMETPAGPAIEPAVVQPLRSYEL